jgi:hypothetical protein
MMLGHTTFQRQFQFRNLVPQQSFGHLGQPGSVFLPGPTPLRRACESCGLWPSAAGLLLLLLASPRSPGSRA